MSCVMIDIETLSCEPNAFILSIGAVLFDWKQGWVAKGTGDQFYQSINMGADFAGKEKFHVDPSTVHFWLMQDGLTHDTLLEGRKNIRELLGEFSFWVKIKAPNEVWANPPSFDLVIIRQALKVVGKDCPWHYRQERCSRTFVETCGVPKELLQQRRYGMKHHALHDAISQAEGILAACEWRDGKRYAIDEAVTPS